MADLIVVYGRRRLGKSELVRESIRSRDEAIYWQPTEETPAVQFEHFVDIPNGNDIDYHYWCFCRGGFSDGLRQIAKTEAGLHRRGARRSDRLETFQEHGVPGPTLDVVCAVAATHCENHYKQTDHLIAYTEATNTSERLTLAE